MHLPTWIKQIITEPDNSTICVVRVTALVGTAQYLGLGTLHYFQHHIFDPQSYAIGFGAILGGLGAALGLKRDSPKA